ncbi:MAG: putative sensor domain DACNV-containing protein [Gemmatimonadaceae bacterium]
MLDIHLDDASVEPPGRAIEYTHPAARAVAEHVHAALAGQAPRAREAMLPDVEAIASAIDVAFWGSLRREEGTSPRVTLAFVSEADSEQALRFERPLSLNAAALARLAPAVEQHGVHLGVARMGGRSGSLHIWGITRHLRSFALVLEVVAPGLLVLKYSPGDGGKFVNLVVLEGDEVQFVDHGAVARSEAHAPAESLEPAGHGPTPLTRQFGLDDAACWWAPIAETLVEIAVAMRAHSRGGTLLVVPRDTEGWHVSLMQTNPYRIALPDDATSGDRPRAGRELTPDDIAVIAGLTAVDGATVLSEACHVLAFGAKIIRRRGRPQVRQALLSQPLAGDHPREVALSRIGGTRHLAAAQFVSDQPDTLALVASQDGRFTVFRWLQDVGAVGARRVDLLLI